MSELLESILELNPSLELVIFEAAEETTLSAMDLQHGASIRTFASGLFIERRAR